MEYRPVKFRRVTRERFDEMLEILPPADWNVKGFLVGEPWTHRTCEVTGLFRAAFQPFIARGGEFFEGDGQMTIPEFRAFNPATMEIAE